jgi:hypothetical protein
MLVSSIDVICYTPISLQPYKNLLCQIFKRFLDQICTLFSLSLEGWVCDGPFKTNTIIKPRVNKQPLVSSGCNVTNQPLQITKKTNAC